MANVKTLIRNSYNLQKEIERLQITLNNNKVQIQKYFDEKNVKLVEAESRDEDEKDVVAQVQQRCYINYNVDAMREKFDVDLFNQIVVKDYFIENINDMVNLLKDAGVKPKDFKKLIKTICTLNKDALKQAFSVGDLTMEDFKDCYTADVRKSIQIKEKN